MLRHSPEALAQLSQRTLEHYDSSAEAFWQGTRDHDVSQNIDALLRFVEAPVARILDFGCGPGRDLLTLRSRGHEPVGLEGSARFCAMARQVSGCQVLHQDFLKLNLKAESFDGVFANASLFHVPTQELPRVLGDLHRCLRPGGAFFSSNPRGQNAEGWNGERYGAYHDLEAWRDFMSAAGFQELDHYYRPTGLPRDQQAWLASTWRRS